MKDYQALNPNPSLPVGSVDSVDLISLKIYKLSILYHSKKKNTDVVKKAYRVYRAYREAWIGISRQISLQNLCRLRGKVYMNPTWRRRWQNRQSFGCLRFAFVYIWKKKNFQIKPKIIPKTSLAGLQSCMIIMQNPVNLLFQHRPEEIRGKADENQADSSKLLKWNDIAEDKIR